MSKYDVIFTTCRNGFEIYVKRCLICKCCYEYREIGAYEAYVDMCRTCDSKERRKLTKLAKQDEVVVLHDGVWQVFKKWYWKYVF